MWTLVLIAAALAQAPSPSELMERGQFTAAVAPLENLRRAHPNDPELLLALGICYSQTGRAEEAATTLRKHVALAPRSADGRAALGVVLLGLGRAADAKIELQQAVRLDPSQLEAAKALARAYTLLGDPAAAVALLRRYPNAGEDARLELARALLKSGDARGAAEELDSQLARNPASAPELYLAAASAHESLGEHERAFAVCEEGMKHHPAAESLESFHATLPRDAFAARTEQRLKQMGDVRPPLDDLIVLGRVMMNIERSRNIGAAGYAEKLLSLAVTVAPENPIALHFHARSLLVLGKPEDAVPEFRRALTLHPAPEMSVLIHTWCGLAEARLSHPDAAEKQLRAAMDVNRTLPRHMVAPAFQYFRYLRDAARSDEAAKINDEILRWEPYYAPALLERARHLSADDKLAEAAEQAELAVRNVESDPDLLRRLHYFLAKTYHAMERPKEAAVHQSWIQSH